MVFAWATSAAKWINKATAGSPASSGLEIFQLLNYNWQSRDVEAQVSHVSQYYLRKNVYANMDIEPKPKEPHGQNFWIVD